MRKTGIRLLHFIKKETVLCIAVLLAVLSAFFVWPDGEYIGYIDFKVLALLFCLMTVLCGFKELGVFETLAEALLGKVKTYRQLLTVQVLLCFFTSMLITNDVALITFVPFAILTLRMIKMQEKLAAMVVLQTIAANLGSMFTPIGNPQNLYIYEKAQMGILEFFKTMLPMTAIAFGLLVLFCCFSQKVPVRLELQERKKEQKSRKDKACFFLFAVLFVLSILTVLRVLHYGVALTATVIGVLIFKKEIFKKVDYSLLVTFVGFFVFVGNLGRVEAFRNFLERVIVGRELPAGFLSSQVLSNVPAAVLLSEFTQDWKALLWGVNIGGLGTLIASMASVISFKLYAEAAETHKGRYLLTFTGYSLLFAAVLLTAAYFLCAWI